MPDYTTLFNPSFNVMPVNTGMAIGPRPPPKCWPNATRSRTHRCIFSDNPHALARTPALAISPPKRPKGTPGKNAATPPEGNKSCAEKAPRRCPRCALLPRLRLRAFIQRFRKSTASLHCTRPPNAIPVSSWAAWLSLTGRNSERRWSKRALARRASRTPVLLWPTPLD